MTVEYMAGRSGRGSTWYLCKQVLLKYFCTGGGIGNGAVEEWMGSGWMVIAVHMWRRVGWTLVVWFVSLAWRLGLLMLAVYMGWAYGGSIGILGFARYVKRVEVRRGFITHVHSSRTRWWRSF